MIKLTFQRNPVEVANDFVPPSSAAVHPLPGPPPLPLLHSVVPELKVPPQTGSSRFVPVFWDIKGVGKDK